jgi:hypothetical protein
MYFVKPYSIVILPARCDGSQEVHRMVLNPILGDHASPVHHTCIVSECKNARVGDFGWEQGLRPRSSGTPCRPCLLAVSSKAVDEYDTGCEGR